MRPYRVGMSCGFCHVGPSPIAPPADPENPKWENLNSTVGAQYFWIDRIFAWEAEPGELHVPARPHLPAGHAGHLAGLDRQHQQPAHHERGLQPRPAPGAWPSAGARRSWPAASSNNKQFNDFVAERPADRVLQGAGHRRARRACSRTAPIRSARWARSNRVYLNIGLFSEEWLLHFNPIVGGKPITPIEIAVAQKNSSYWQATEAQTPLDGAVLPEGGPARPAGGRARRRART